MSIVRDNNGREIGFICTSCRKFSQGFTYGYFTCGKCNEQNKRDNESIKLRKEIERLNSLLESNNLKK